MNTSLFKIYCDYIPGPLIQGTKERRGKGWIEVECKKKGGSYFTLSARGDIPCHTHQKHSTLLSKWGRIALQIVVFTHAFKSCVWCSFTKEVNDNINAIHSTDILFEN